MVRRREQNMGNEALREATGHTHEQWREILDEAGAKAWSHQDTATWLVQERGVPGWWAQGITIDYEQSRKGRVPGQRSDGTFAAQKAQTIPRERLDALAKVAAVVTEAYGEPSGSNLAASLPNVRWKLDDGTKINASAGAPNKSGTPITLAFEKLSSSDAATAARARCEELFALVG